MRKYNSLILVLVVVAALFNYAGYAAAQNDGEDPPETIEYIVTAETANLRSGPSTTDSVVGQVTRGARVFAYADGQTTTGWLLLYREGEDDAWIADFLVERAPVRFYPADQEPIFELSGRGRLISDPVSLPRGAYRVDADVNDREFTLEAISSDGKCDDTTILDEFNIDIRHTVVSASLVVSEDCEFVFQMTGTSAEWSFEVRDILGEARDASLLEIEDDTTIRGVGTQFTMPTSIPAGLWRVSIDVNDQAFILVGYVNRGDCDTEYLFNELDFDAERLETFTLLRIPAGGCTFFWEVSNVEHDWQFTFTLN